MMSLFKISGIFCSFLSCTVIGFYLSSRIKRRKMLLLEFQTLLQQIATEMRYFKEPLPQIFQRILEQQNSLKQSNPVTLLLRQCTCPQSQNEYFDVLWKEAVSQTYMDEPLNDEDRQVLSQCGSFLGQSDFQSQEGHFQLLYRELDKRIHDAEENNRTKAVLYRKAGLSVGVVIAIVML